MMQKLIPYHSYLFFMEQDVVISFPANSKINVVENEKIGYSDKLAVFRKSEVLQTFPIDSKFSTKVFDGELVKRGSLLGKRKDSLSKRTVTKSDVEGIVRIFPRRIDIVDVKRLYELPSGIIGKVMKIDNLNNKFYISAKGAGVQISYSSCESVVSGILGVDFDSEVIFFEKYTKALFLKAIVQKPGLIIFSFLTKGQFGIVSKSLEEQRIPFCIVGSNNKGEEYEEIVKIFHKIVGKRISLNQRFLFSTGWKITPLKKNYTKFKEGSLVVFTDFKLGRISCKMGEVKVNSVYVLRNGKRKKTSYLNILKL